MHIESFISNAVEIRRYKTLLATLDPWTHLFRSQRVLDFGASYALSTLALLELGAVEVTGVEPDPARVERGQEILELSGCAGRARLLRIGYDPALEFEDNQFGFVLANAVLEHIPGPRTPYLRELWRVLKPNGHLVINESPNKYLPRDIHTTQGLWFVPWMPESLARRYAVWRGRFSRNENWKTSGWRGVGYYEISRSLGPHENIPELTRSRHRFLQRAGLPPNLIDPYPTLVFRKL